MSAVHEIDWKARSFLADLYWWIRYPKPASEEEGEKIEALEFVNGEIPAENRKVQERKELMTPAGPEIYVSFRTIGRFHFEADFQRYPFDRQRLPIVVEHEVFMSTDLELVDDMDSYSRSSVAKDRWGLAESVRVPDLEIRRVYRDFAKNDYKTDFGDPSVATPTSQFSRATLTIEVERHFVPYLIKILIPLLIILALAYLVFFIPAQNLEVAAGLTVTSLLACIAFQLTLATNLPDVGYVMISDFIFHLSYVLIMLAMAQTVYTYNLDKRGNPELADKLELWSRWAYPGLFVVGMVAIVLRGVL